MIAEYAFPIVAIVLLVIMNGLFVAAEFALVGARLSRLRAIADNGSGAANWLVDVFERHAGKDSYIAVAQLGITLASIGDSVVAIGMSSTSFQLDVGFDAAYPPPGEVLDLTLTDKETLVWNAEPSAGLYNVYRDDTSDGYGSCEEQNLVATMTTDTTTPPVGYAFHYLVTVKNRIADEGTKGFQNDMTTERLGLFDLPPCP